MFLFNAPFFVQLSRCCFLLRIPAWLSWSRWMNDNVWIFQDIIIQTLRWDSRSISGLQYCWWCRRVCCYITFLNYYIYYCKHGNTANVVKHWLWHCRSTSMKRTKLQAGCKINRNIIPLEAVQVTWSTLSHLNNITSQVILFQFSPFWSYVSLAWPTTSSGWKKIVFA